MALTPLNDFSSGTATNAGDMNDNFTTIEDEWDEKRVTATAGSSFFASTTTTSTSYVSTNITDTIDIDTTSKIICWTGFLSSVDTRAEWQLQIGGTAVASTIQDIGGGGHAATFLSGELAGATSGTITAVVRVKRTNGAGNIVAGLGFNGGSLKLMAVEEE